VNITGALLLPIFIPSWNYVNIGTELVFVPIVSIVGLILALIRYQDNWLLDQQTQARLNLEQQQKEYLEENEYRFRSFFEGIQIGMVILDYQGHPVYTNPQLTKLLGYSPEEFAGRPFASLMASEDTFDCGILIRKLLSGEIQQGRAEKRMVGKNGDVVWTRIHIGTFPHTRPFPIEDFLIAVVEDVTDSKLIEAQLAATQAYNQAILEAMPDMVFTVNREGIFTGFKPSNELEPLVPPEDFIGHDMATVLPDIADMTMGHVRRVLDTGKGARFEYQMNIHATPEDYEARVIAKNSDEVLIFIRDMNDRRLLEKQAVELALGHQRSAVLHELMTSISHDFRTPLAIINTQTYLIRRAGVSDGQAGELTNIEEQVRYLKTTLDNLSEVLHLNEALKLIIQTGSLQDIARQVYMNYNRPAQEKQIALELELDSNVPSFPMDRERLSDALRRLVENALDYTPAPGQVMIRVYREANSAVIAVRDTGIGIGEEHLQHIFKPLYRADRARTGVSAGKTGLGLSIVQHIITAHGGRIEVESQAGQGSVFRVLLPLEIR
ncbi:MAG: PAS domain S-box protein, partial [Anaerolineae bacterium]|nr:PAS domain S-box protein [Anaerolineae bacterium]